MNFIVNMKSSHGILSKTVTHDTDQGRQNRRRLRKSWANNIKEWTDITMTELLKTTGNTESRKGYLFIYSWCKQSRNWWWWRLWWCFMGRMLHLIFSSPHAFIQSHWLHGFPWISLAAQSLFQYNHQVRIGVIIYLSLAEYAILDVTSMDTLQYLAL